MCGCGKVVDIITIIQFYSRKFLWVIYLNTWKRSVFLEDYKFVMTLLICFCFYTFLTLFLKIWWYTSFGLYIYILAFNVYWQDVFCPDITYWLTGRKDPNYSLTVKSGKADVGWLCALGTLWGWRLRATVKVPEVKSLLLRPLWDGFMVRCRDVPLWRDHSDGRPPGFESETFPFIFWSEHNTEQKPFPSYFGLNTTLSRNLSLHISVWTQHWAHCTRVN